MLVVCVHLAATFAASGAWAGQWPSVIDLTPGADAADVYVLGAGDQAGSYLSAGDVNGDGETDLLVFAAGATPMGRTYAGLLYVVWGPVPSDTVDLSQAAVPHSLIVPPINSFGLWSSVDCGDFNNDGFDDLVLGIPCEYPSFYCKGKALIVFGRADFPSTVDLQNPSVDVTTVLGSSSDVGWLGYALAHGNVNGDLYDDLVVSAPAHSPGGHVYIVHGRAAFPQTLDLNLLQAGVTRLVESEFGWGAGQSLACDDVNGDGADELLIGEPGNAGQTAHGKAILFYGYTSLPTTITLDASTPGTKHIGSDPLQPGAMGTGSALADFDGDGEIDILLSASGIGLSGCSECGVVYVLYGADALPSSFSVTSAIVPTTCIIGNFMWRMGRAMFFGDFNDDGRADVAASAVQSGSGEKLKVIVVYGLSSRPGAIMATNPDFATIVNGESDDDNFGFAMSTSDINGDSVSDLSIGAKWATVGTNLGAGKVYTLYGVESATAIAATPAPGVVLRAFPNPSAGSVTIEYSLARASDVVISVYDVRGRRLIARSIPDVPAGVHMTTWEGSDFPSAISTPFPSGVYFLRIDALGESMARKIILVR